MYVCVYIYTHIHTYTRDNILYDIMDLLLLVLKDQLLEALLHGRGRRAEHHGGRPDNNNHIV